jgi:hypothetical protein
VTANDSRVIAKPSTAMRRLQLHARCELERNELAQQVEQIEQRLHGTDAVLGSIRNVLTKPSVIAGGLALMMGLSRSTWWAKLSRLAVVVGTARRVYQAFKRR